MKIFNSQIFFFLFSINILFGQDFILYDESDSPIFRTPLALAIDSSNHIWVSSYSGMLFKDGMNWIKYDSTFFGDTTSYLLITNDIKVSYSGTIFFLNSPWNYKDDSFLYTINGNERKNFNVSPNSTIYQPIKMLIDNKERVWIILQNDWPHQYGFDDVALFENDTLRNLEDPKLSYISSLAYRNDSLFVPSAPFGIYTNGSWSLLDTLILDRWLGYISNLNNKIILFSNQSSYRFNGVTFESYSLAIDNILSQNNTNVSAAIAQNDTVIWLGTDNGMLLKYNGDKVKIALESLGGEIRNLNIDKNKNVWFIISFAGVGLYNEDKIVGIYDFDKELPSAFNLSQNYPNPFNPTTRIKYQVASIENVSLKVYDALGREIKTLINKPMQPGEYEVEFDATDLPSGVYFYKLSSGSFSQTRKMVLLR